MLCLFLKYVLTLLNRKDVDPLVNGSHELFKKFPKLGVSLAYMVLKPKLTVMKTTYVDIFGKYIGQTSDSVRETSGKCY
jgi:hypothetical protein